MCVYNSVQSSIENGKDFKPVEDSSKALESFLTRCIPNLKRRPEIKRIHFIITKIKQQARPIPA